MRSLVAILLLGACTEPIVAMEFVPPPNAANYSTSCITAVEVRATGADIVQDVDDYEYGCIEIPGGSSYEAIRASISGKFELDIPDSGLSGIEVFGWSGPNSCEQEDDPFYSEFYATPNLLFLGRGDYIGQDKIEVPITANLGCADTPIKVRMFDMFALIGGATCDVAGTAPPAEGGASVGTMVPRLVGQGVEGYGFLEGAISTGNTASFTGSMQAGGKACVTIDGGYTDVSGSTGCYNGGQAVCAAPGEVEHPIIPFSIMYNGANFDDDLVAKFPGQIIGSVWNNATPRVPVAGAKVTIDSAHGTVVYVDAPDANGVMAKRATQDGTGPSGLFILYTDTVSKVKIEANGGMREVQLASLDDRVSVAMIVMGP